MTAWFALIPAAAAQQPADSGWTSAAGDPALTRFSPLASLTPANVAGLKVKWSRSTGSARAHEGNPLVVGSRMFVHTPFPNAVLALDLARPDSAPVWRYEVPPAVARKPPPVGCCDFGNRGLAWHPAGLIFVPLLQGQLAALDAQTGREVWRVTNADGAAGATMPAAPVVAGDVLVVGTAGADFGVRGYLTGYEARTGKLLWRGYHTGPDADILLTGDANANYASHRGRGLGVSTWPSDQWLQGGGTASGWISYDPELDLIYYGTDHPGTLNASLRPGANKWTGSLFARSATTGAVRWILQLTPHDQWGYDASNESILTDIQIRGEPVKALVHFDRNGFVYTIDRTSGRLLLTERYGPVNWASRIDPATAEPVVVPRYTQASGRVRGVCPSLLGTKGLQPAAYSAKTGLFYVPTGNLCMDLTPTAVTFRPGRSYDGATVRFHPTPGPGQGRLVAWNAATGTAAWQVQEEYPIASGVLATGGGLVFYGTLDGWLKAVDDRSGLEVWRYKTPSGIIGSPITWLGADGRQYLAVYAGLGGWLGAGAGAALPDIAALPPTDGVLLVFGL